jgi:hypothetical protein
MDMHMKLDMWEIDLYAKNIKSHNYVTNYIISIPIPDCSYMHMSHELDLSYDQLWKALKTSWDKFTIVSNVQ